MSRKAVTVAVGVAGIAAAALVFAGRAQHNRSLEYVPPTQEDFAQHPLYETYDFGEAGHVLRLGTQPLLYPTGLIMEAVRRDAVLRAELQDLDIRLDLFSFFKGDDVNHFLLRGDLDAGIGGDMPTLRAVASGGVTVASVLQRGYTSVLSKNALFTSDLKGRKIGYAIGSNAYYALMKSLDAEGFSGNDVELVPMDVTEMSSALESGRVHAFSGWEPTVEAFLVRSPGTVVTSRTLGTGFLYFSDRLLMERPEAARLILAAQLRATRWMLSSRENLRRATEWSIQEAERFSGESFPLSTARAMDLAERELLGLGSTPVASEAELAPFGRLSIEFRFLKERSWIETDLEWDEAVDAFDVGMITEIVENPDLYRLEEYRYLDEPPTKDPREPGDSG